MNSANNIERALAIIPARGGSKRIPRKNLRCFAGKPIISYSIEAALSSRLFAEVMVSTDDYEIADQAKALGARVPFLRSTRNADDNAGLKEVIAEVLTQYRELGSTFQYICCILATAPFVSADLLRAGFLKLKSADAQCIVPICRFSYPVQRALRVRKERTEMFYPQFSQVRSQDLEPAYHDAGLFYWLRSGREESELGLLENAAPLVIPSWQCQDIDTDEDWGLAEVKYSALKGAEQA